MVLAAFAHMASAVAAAAVLTPVRCTECGKGVARRAMAASFCAAASFLFLPLGSLPPVAGGAYGAVFFFCFFAASLLLAKYAGIWTALAALMASFGVVAWFFHSRGAPGHILNMGTFSAMPFWRIVSILDGTGFLLLAAAAFLAILFILRRPASPGFHDTLIALAACAFWASLFFPFNLAPLVPWSTRLAAGADAVLFWMKVLAVHRAAVFSVQIPRNTAIMCLLLYVSSVLLYVSL